MDAVSGASVSLSDKYLKSDGPVFLTGMQTLVRVLLDQARADTLRGLRTAGFVSGYQGSPLGGLDSELGRQHDLLHQHQIVFQPGLNEELALTSVYGSQLVSQQPGARHQGVFGMWYGKAPGVDRAADAIRHANLAGVSRHGGALLLAGDDPSAKSSTVPSASEPLLASLHVPVLYPGTLEEILAYGLHAYTLSRASGLWAAMKIVTSVADSAGTIQLPASTVADLGFLAGRAAHQPDGNLLAPVSLDLERSLIEQRLPAAVDYAAANQLNRATVSAADAWLGIIAAGKSYHDMRQSLADLGLHDDDLARHGVRIMQLGMVWPLDEQHIRDFAGDVQQLLVVEDKLPFIERGVKEALYGHGHMPAVLGKRDLDGSVLLPADGELTADRLTEPLVRVLTRTFEIPGADRRLQQILRAQERAPATAVTRTPFFCSGCPHNTSTPAADGTLVGAGIGCHTMVLLNPDGRGDVVGITQMGGEGAQWIGMAPFTDTGHFVQNVGDGTFHHSASLAVRASVAAGSNITYKLLYNTAVAMTGGQDVQGAMTVADLTFWLAREGVRRIIITTEDPSRYDKLTLAPISCVRHRDQIIEAQQDLAATRGVTVLIHDQQCAAEARRLRKRGKLTEPDRRVFINERVCEGCGDCGEKSGCLSVTPVPTEFGRKTQIDQTSCNKDFSCLEGDCPSFLEVVPAAGRVRDEPPAAPDCPLPQRAHSGRLRVRMAGIGGTGVVTLSQVLGMAASLDGWQVRSLDQTGLAQKGGTVISDLTLTRERTAGSNRLGAAHADVLLGFDTLSASTPAALSVCDPDRTAAILNLHVTPTAAMVLDPDQAVPDIDKLQDAVRVACLAVSTIDAAAVCERLFADTTMTNTLLLGAAWQHGLIPVSLTAIQQAFTLNGSAVARNLQAFAWGRALSADPDRLQQLLSPDDESRTDPWADQLAGELPEPVRALASRRMSELAAYQHRRLARRYLQTLQAVSRAETEVDGGSAALTVAVAEGLFKLLAYKDEYEVARLHLDPVQRARLRAQFGPDAQVRYLLHPPLLRALGLRNKIALGSWVTLVFRLLRAARRLRGSRLDPFGYAQVRRLERQLIRDYERDLHANLAGLDARTLPLLAEWAGTPDLVRGYEHVKLAAVARYRDAQQQLQSQIDTPAASELPLLRG